MLWYLVLENVVGAPQSSAEQKKVAGETLAAWMASLGSVRTVIVIASLFAVARLELSFECLSDEETVAAIKKVVKRPPAMLSNYTVPLVCGGVRLVEPEKASCFKDKDDMFVRLAC